MKSCKFGIVLLILFLKTSVYSQTIYFEYLMLQDRLSFIPFYSSFGFYNGIDDIVEMQNFKDYGKLMAKNKVKRIKIDSYYDQDDARTRYYYFNEAGNYLLGTDSATVSDTARRTEICFYKNGELISVREKLRKVTYDSNHWDYYAYNFEYDKKTGFLSKLIIPDNKEVTNYFYDTNNRLNKIEFVDSISKNVVKYLYTDTTILIFENDTLSTSKWVIDKKNKRIKSYSDSIYGFSIDYSGSNYSRTDVQGMRIYSANNVCSKLIFRFMHENDGCRYSIYATQYNDKGLITEHTITEYYPTGKPMVTRMVYSYSYFK